MQFTLSSYIINFTSTLLSLLSSLKWFYIKFVGIFIMNNSSKYHDDSLLSRALPYKHNSIKYENTSSVNMMWVNALDSASSVQSQVAISCESCKELSCSIISGRKLLVICATTGI